MNTISKEKTKLIPKLRFPEFDGEWRRTLLDNISIRGSGHTPNKEHPEYYNGGIKWISLADSNKLDKGYISETKIEISENGLKNSSAVLHPAGTVLLSRDAGVGKSAVMKHEMAVSQHFMAWRAKDQILSNWFLYYTMQILKREFERIAIGNTIKTIGLPYFKKLKINMTSFLEQQKIAAFLSAVDKKIQRLTRKKELLEQYKKGVMQKIFSQEIRFKDENGNDYPDWEEVIIDKAVKEINERTTVSDQYPVLSSSKDGIFFQSEYFNKQTASEDNRNYKIVNRGMFTYRSMSDTGRFTFNQQNLIEKGIVSPAYPVFIASDYVNPMYLYVFLNDASFFKSQIAATMEGSTRLALGFNKLRKMVIQLPNKEEQNMIAKFLSGIDNKIDMIHNQLSRTQLFKKGLLQQMFV